MDVTRCPKCNKRLVATDRTGSCLKCDEVDPLKTDAAKWADSPLALGRLNKVIAGKLPSDPQGPLRRALLSRGVISRFQPTFLKYLATGCTGYASPGLGTELIL